MLAAQMCIVLAFRMSMCLTRIAGQMCTHFSSGALSSIAPALLCAPFHTPSVRRGMHTSGVRAAKASALTDVAVYYVPPVDGKLGFIVAAKDRRHLTKFKGRPAVLALKASR